MSTDLSGGEWLENNRANWDERVPVHLASGFEHYDQEPLRNGRGVLDPVVAAEIAQLYPDGLAGLRVLHLQCHFGSDTLSLALQGATVVGLDFSRPAVQEARRMAAEIGLADRARFIEANVYDARHMLPEPESFDLVFTTWGTIGWLPDVREWARIISWFLKPDGRFYFADGHPAAWVFDGEGGPDRLPQFAYPYLSEGPDVIEEPGDYADANVVLANARTWEWAHPLSEVYGALTDAGLGIRSLHEHYEVPFRMFPVLEEKRPGMWGWPQQQWLPLAYSLVATPQP
ncbi:class I SAM-dependent methyltransferase [Rathayibacter sp. YIM 133350]|uniref:class I SAM-dependent methyltransferase n=1 Tax=Rathayibacter sp. YIM 133350 TaxID=3131992 RepID=UPI00307D18EF